MQHRSSWHLLHTHATGQNAPCLAVSDREAKDPPYATGGDVGDHHDRARTLRESAMGLVVGLLFFTRATQVGHMTWPSTSSSQARKAADSLAGAGRPHLTHCCWFVVMLVGMPEGIPESKPRVSAQSTTRTSGTHLRTRRSCRADGQSRAVVPGKAVQTVGAADSARRAQRDGLRRPLPAPKAAAVNAGEMCISRIGPIGGVSVSGVAGVNGPIHSEVHGLDL